jgi:hypothetical protein
MLDYLSLFRCKPVRVVAVLALIVLVSASVLLAARPSQASAGSITTEYVTDVVCGANDVGVMFDLTAAGFDVTITGFDTHFISTGKTANVSVYYKDGTYVGSESAPGDWTLLGTANVTSAGDGNPVNVPIGGVTIPAGQTYGLYVYSDRDFWYMGGGTYSNADVTLANGFQRHGVLYHSGDSSG